MSDEPSAKRMRDGGSSSSPLQDNDETRDVQKQLEKVEEDIKQITAAIQSKDEEISGVQVKIEKVDQEIQGKIDKVDQEISSVQVEIDQVNVEIIECIADLKSVSISETQRSMLLEKEKSLRDEKKSLRNEKESLRDKEKSLRDEKKSLRDEQKSLRDEKKSLSDKEARLGAERMLLIKKKEEVASPVDQKRLAVIDFGVKKESLKHRFDLSLFVKEVKQLFTWFKEDGKVRKEIKAPYFPLVQSSGMGKTKLLYEADQLFNQGNDVRSLLILCMSGSEQATTMPDIYSDVLLVERLPTNSTRNSITRKLDSVVKELKAGQVVLFFDEAQHLLEKDAFGFRCVRWWLKKERTSHQVAAVFAGTSSGLANYFKDDHPPSQFSRDVPLTYIESGNKGFDPFFRLFTIGLFVNHQSSMTDPTTDYDIAVPYGRPLFALIHIDGKLDESKEMTIFDRMTLSKKKWCDDDLACLSLLGTRLQMGQTSLSVASHLVKQGYACLTYFSEPAKMAQIAFMPDPVCARLAMCAMDPKWDKSDNMKGLEKHVWSRKMIDIVSKGFCHPHKGNLGEVASALYLLFCGDLLRASIDPFYHCFQVPLESFLSVAFNPIQALPSQTADTKSPHVSFIQVCRNHARVSAKNRFSRTSLEWMFNAACACYCYEGCPAIDWFAPIRVVDKNDTEEVSFVPLVVSVKARREFSHSQVLAAFESMQKELKKGEQETGVCLLFLIGLDKPGKFTSGFYNVTKETKGTSYTQSPNQNCDSLVNSILYVLVCVQEGDTFGLSDVVTQTTMDGDERAEVYTSHGLLRSLPTEKDCPSSTVVRKRSEEDVKKYMKELRKALEGIDKIAVKNPDSETY